MPVRSYASILSTYSVGHLYVGYIIYVCERCELLELLEVSVSLRHWPRAGQQKHIELHTKRSFEVPSRSFEYL